MYDLITYDLRSVNDVFQIFYSFFGIVIFVKFSWFYNNLVNGVKTNQNRMKDLSLDKVSFCQPLSKQKKTIFADLEITKGFKVYFGRDR